MVPISLLECWIATSTVFFFNSFLIDSGFTIPSSSGETKDTSILFSFNKNLIGSKTAGCSMVEVMMCGVSQGLPFEAFFPKVTPWEIPRIATFNDSVPPEVKNTSLARQCKTLATLILASSKIFFAPSPS